MSHWSASVLLILGVAGCAHGPPEAREPAPAEAPPTREVGSMIIGSAELTLPEGVTGETHQVIDFQLTMFHYQGEHILTAYAGNFPSFPSEECGTSASAPLALGSFVAFEARCAKGAELYREVGVELESDWPGVVHFMQPDRRRELGDAIIDSIEPTKPASEQPQDAR